MSIQANEIISRVRQVGLDAEGADYYRDDLDIIPAINAGIEWLVSVINAAFGAKKIGEEVFQDLVKASVFQTSVYSRIRLPEGIWTILGVFPNPVLHPAGAVIDAVSNPEDSKERTDLSHISALSGAARLTIEEWSDNRGNPFAKGNEVQTEGIEYAYLNAADYSSTSYLSASTPKRELEIRPLLNRKFVTVFIVKNHPVISSGADFVLFPQTLANILTSKAIQYISYKQGDQTNLFTVTQNDIVNLISAIQ